MNTTELLIDNTDLELAQNIGKFINDKTLRSKAIASVFAVNIAGKFFDTEKYDIDTISIILMSEYFLKKTLLVFHALF